MIRPRDQRLTPSRQPLRKNGGSYGFPSQTKDPRVAAEEFDRDHSRYQVLLCQSAAVLCRSHSAQELFLQHAGGYRVLLNLWRLGSMLATLGAYRWVWQSYQTAEYLHIILECTALICNVCHRSLSCKGTTSTRCKRLRSQHVSNVELLVPAVCLSGNWQLAASKDIYRLAARIFCQQTHTSEQRPAMCLVADVGSGTYQRACVHR